MKISKNINWLKFRKKMKVKNFGKKTKIPQETWKFRKRWKYRKHKFKKKHGNLKKKVENIEKRNCQKHGHLKKKDENIEKKGENFRKNENFGTKKISKKCSQKLKLWWIIEIMFNVLEFFLEKFPVHASCGKQFQFP